MAEILLSVSGFIPEDIHRQIAQGRRPQADYLALAAGLPAELLDFGCLRREGRRISRLAGRLLGLKIGLAIEMFQRRKDYPVLFTDGEQVGMPLAFLLKLFGRGPLVSQHMMIAHILSVGKKKVLFDLLGLQTHIDRFLAYSTYQVNFIRQRWELPEERVIRIPYQVDDVFFAPEKLADLPEDNLIASAGLEYRDYPTLIEAVGQMDVRVFLAAASPWSKRADSSTQVPLPANVKVGRLNLGELRQLYAQSTLVVVPLYPVEFQAGVTTLLEAMSMSKAVIVTRTRGQTDVVLDGETGIYVPPGDAPALRSALLDLLGDPEKRARLGKAARQQVIESMSLERYVQKLRDIALKLALRPATTVQSGRRQTSLKVAFFSNSITFGGMEVYLSTLAAALKELHLPVGEVEVTVILPEDKNLDSFAARCVELGLPVVRLTLTGEQPIKDRFRKLLKLASWLRQNRIDILHQHRTGPFHGKWALLAARVAGTPYIVATEHNAPFEKPSPIQHGINWVADRMLAKIVVVSEEDRRRQIEIGGRDASKIARVYPGIDFRGFNPLTQEARRQKREQLGIPADTPLVGVVCRLVENKGVSTFLEAVAALRVPFPDLHALVVGAGEQAEQLKDYSQKLGLDSSAIFAGFRTDIAELVGCMDVFVLASIYEPFGMVIVEAMAMKVPVVATSVGGVPEIIEDEVTGLLVPPRDAEAMAVAISRFLEDSSLAWGCSERAFQGCHGRFNLERMARETFALYSGLQSKLPAPS